MEQAELLRHHARVELARREFYEYCRLRYPGFYTDDRLFLRDLCYRLQNFIEASDKRFMVVNLPPRHGKSFTGKNLTEWLFGKNTGLKVMTGSYNATLSGSFASQVRDTIDERKAGEQVVYSDIFPDTRIKYGEASSSLWTLEGNKQKSYLATSPTGTATGFGANIEIIDDIIKNDTEAYNEALLEAHWDWLTNTMIQRTEGDDWKIIIIMTRWSTQDLAGRVLAAYEDVEHVTYTAVQDDGSMLCPSLLSRQSYDVKTQEMNHDIVEANYNQKPINVTGRLYPEFIEYDELPPGSHLRRNYTDTADKGTDFLCSVDWLEHDGNVYITDVVMSDEGMEETEPQVAEMLNADAIDEAEFESNNGGRGFSRNVERILREAYNNRRCVVSSVPQTQNKEARILASSAWVPRHVFMPRNWKTRFKAFHHQLASYQKKGRNAHDDAPDVLAAIYERVTNGQEPTLRFI